MRIVAINTFNNGSTGKTMQFIAEVARRHGAKYYTCVPRARDNYKNKVRGQIFIGNRFTRNVHVLFSKITGFEGCFSVLSTYCFLKRINPEIIHLHNIHGSYINYLLLFRFIKKNNIKVLWTLHDCWSFTGKCPHFDALKCNKWKSQCSKCMYPSSDYLGSYLDTSAINYQIKKRCFLNVRNLTIITPSRWLANQVKESFLKSYPVRVINNGIDLGVFKPTVSSFRKDHNIDIHTRMILGVAFNWDYKKGLDVFVDLAYRLKDECVIVMVGTNETTEKSIPQTVKTIRRIDGAEKMAEVYSAADVFVNPTREDTYPTVNMEAIACGCPVITYNTGGSMEMIDPDCGCVVEKDDIEGLIKAIKRVLNNDREEYKRHCLEKARAFDMDLRIKEYTDLYERE